MKVFAVLVILSSLEVFRVYGIGCSSQIDCQSNECCLTNNPPRGKRFLDSKANGGHCVPMGTSGQHCYAGHGVSGHPPSGITLWCPCDSNLSCNGTGLYEVPLGEIGKCVNGAG